MFGSFMKNNIFEFLHNSFAEFYNVYISPLSAKKNPNIVLQISYFYINHNRILIILNIHTNNITSLLLRSWDIIPGKIRFEMGS